jgi:hypothetical protein
MRQLIVQQAVMKAFRFVGEFAKINSMVLFRHVAGGKMMVNSAVPA